MSAIESQVGGTHYKQCAIQPVQYIHANGIGYMEGNVIKYITRWRDKGGIADLEKAKHYIELLIELETKQSNKDAPVESGEWIRWSDGGCPVPFHTNVEVQLSSGKYEKGKAGYFCWHKASTDCNIIAYRIIKD